MRSKQAHPSDAKSSHWLRLGTFVLTILVIGLSVLFWPSRPKKPVSAKPPEAEANPFLAAPSPPAAQAHEAARAPRSPPPDPPPVIDEVLVEKPEVCSGEENLITIRAHTVNGTNEFLHYVIDGDMGASVPVRLALNQHGAVVGQHFIRVFGRTNTEVTVPLPAYKVKDCQPTRIVLVGQRLRANSNSDFYLQARVMTLPPREGEKRGDLEPFVPVSYAWTFGDGAVNQTSVPLTMHSYEDRAQDSLYSYFTVGVEVRDANGVKVAGRTTVPLINPAFEAFAGKGIVQLLIALEPRFPELDSDGRVVERVKLWHTRPTNVTIEKAVMVEYFESAAGQRPPETVDPAALLGTTTIPAGKHGILTTITLDTLANPGVFSVTYQLTGHSADGHPAMGSFSVMRPPARLTRDNSEPVVDSKLEAKILAARQILHQDVVNDEDLWRLEREGSFANLPQQDDPLKPNATVQNAAPPAMPKPDHVKTGPPVPTSIAPASAAALSPAQSRPPSK